mmetsp:Transcript_105066/g.250103  ORF Transcript_105066/g.250103 Transcript_105066/m.250103 type:complete len:246 (+) Transcript_105066:91-828(+)
MLYKPDVALLSASRTSKAQHHRLKDLGTLMDLVQQCLENWAEPLVVVVSPQYPNLADAVLWINVSKSDRCCILDETGNIVLVAEYNHATSGSLGHTACVDVLKHVLDGFLVCVGDYYLTCMAFFHLCSEHRSKDSGSRCKHSTMNWEMLLAANDLHVGEPAVAPDLSGNFLRISHVVCWLCLLQLDDKPDCLNDKMILIAVVLEEREPPEATSHGHCHLVNLPNRLPGSFPSGKLLPFSINLCFQ